ncbi:MAG: helix-turn-helix domain-containing protein [Bacillota bacterium]
MAPRGRSGRVSTDQKQLRGGGEDLLRIKWMTVKQVSVYLQISVSKVYQMAQEGQIPCCRLGQQWRFDREEIDRWLKGR